MMMLMMMMSFHYHLNMHRIIASSLCRTADSKRRLYWFASAHTDDSLFLCVHHYQHILKFIEFKQLVVEEETQTTTSIFCHSTNHSCTNRKNLFEKNKLIVGPKVVVSCTVDTMCLSVNNSENSCTRGSLLNCNRYCLLFNSRKRIHVRQLFYLRLKLKKKLHTWHIAIFSI